LPDDCDWYPDDDPCVEETPADDKLAELEDRSIALAAALNAFFKFAKLLFFVGCAAGMTME
jgi:hypothetical protein